MVESTAMFRHSPHQLRSEKEEQAESQSCSNTETEPNMCGIHEYERWIMEVLHGLLDTEQSYLPR